MDYCYNCSGHHLVDDSGRCPNCGRLNICHYCTNTERLGKTGCCADCAKRQGEELCVDCKTYFRADMLRCDSCIEIYVYRCIEKERESAMENAYQEMAEAERERLSAER